MSTCLISKGRKLACNEFIGGLRTVYFANYGDLDGITVDTGNTVTELPTGLTLYKYELKGTSNLVETLTSDFNNGIVSVDQVLTLDLAGGDADMHNQVLLMGYGRPHIIISDHYGNSKLMGRIDGCNVSTGVHQTGAAKKDKHGYTITFNAEERTFCNFLEGATILDPFAGMTNKPTIVTE